MPSTRTSTVPCVLLPRSAWDGMCAQGSRDLSTMHFAPIGGRTFRAVYSSC